MTDIGRRPTLEELLRILHGIERIEADVDVYNKSVPTFRIMVTFSREKLGDFNANWAETMPTPTWLFEQITEELQGWYKQRIREEQWASKEERFNSSIESVMAYWADELHRATHLQGISDRIAVKLISNTILRLQELLERRAAGGVYSKTESRREKARKAWMDDETEAPKREEEQRKQRERYESGTNYSTGLPPGWAEAFEQQFRKDYEDVLKNTFFHGQSEKQQQRPATPPPSGKRSWYEILGCAPGASRDEIRKAARKAARGLHPDKNTNPKDAELFKEISEAKAEGLGGV